MTFALQPVVPADAQGLATTMMSAWYENPHWVFRWQNTTLEIIIGYFAERIPRNLITGRLEKRHQKVVVVETGEVVGYARWLLPPDLAEKKVWPEAAVAEPSPEDRELFEKRYQAITDGLANGDIPRAKTDGMIEFRSRPLEEADARIMKDGPYLVLDYLTVAPKFQRQGIATMLVKSGLEIADTYRVKAHVMSSPAGLKVYSSQGFKIMETTSTDYSQFGGTEPFVHHFMVRQPVSAEV